MREIFKKCSTERLERYLRWIEVILQERDLKQSRYHQYSLGL